MNRRTLHYTLPLFGIIFFGLVYNQFQLFDKFKSWIKAKKLKISDEEAMALWYVGSEREKEIGIGDLDELTAMANKAFKELPKNTKIDLSKF